ncbi:uncharacterized protein EDB93DRAFT_1103274 [Suillus bovinus]|uniref:uncharacterized protein n=1 Tax=Suillus bovinus TaxID=48563 RepID=UPI001B86DF3E|nr:uncharacterized protein EDB93DRAFT_1103274 [Suillus bovinus]KAG2151052.1 hypothetical protein EDB93DRAFT_1103274 [Suillus bovinus]
MIGLSDRGGMMWGLGLFWRYEGWSSEEGDDILTTMRLHWRTLGQLAPFGQSRSQSTASRWGKSGLSCVNQPIEGNLTQVSQISVFSTSQAISSLLFTSSKNSQPLSLSCPNTKAGGGKALNCTGDGIGVNCADSISYRIWGGCASGEGVSQWCTALEVLAACQVSTCMKVVMVQDGASKKGMRHTCGHNQDYTVDSTAAHFEFSASSLVAHSSSCHGKLTQKCGAVEILEGLMVTPAKIDGLAMIIMFQGSSQGLHHDD